MSVRPTICLFASLMHCVETDFEIYNFLSPGSSELTGHQIQMEYEKSAILDQYLARHLSWI